jgi:hypothetical protein
VITGPVLRSRTLTSTKGASIQITVTKVDRTPANIAELRKTSEKWLKQARAIPARGQPEQLRQARMRAVFASDVAFIAARALTDNRSRVVVALDPAGDVLGIADVWREPTGTWNYAFQTTRPHDQPGWPAGDEGQVRGIGAEVTGATLALMNSEVCGDVILHCLDAAACRHWHGVGFVGPDPNLKMTCPQATLAAQRYANTPHEDPSKGEELTAGVASELEKVHVPGPECLRGCRTCPNCNERYCYVHKCGALPADFHRHAGESQMEEIRRKQASGGGFTDWRENRPRR